MKVAVALLFGVIVFSCVSGMSELGDAPSSASSRTSAAATPATSSALAVPPLPSGWEYEKEEDPLTKKVTTLATLKSENELSLDFPYQGRNHGRLWVRQSPRHGLDAFFAIERGQLICGYGEGECRVRVSFDSAAPVTFSMSKPADSNSTTLFFNDAKRFIRLASSAKEIRVAAVVYKSGEPTLKFGPVAPLVWPAK